MINFFFLALLFLLWFYSSPVPAEETPVLQAGLFAPFLAFLSRLWYGPTPAPAPEKKPAADSQAQDQASAGEKTSAPAPEKPSFLGRIWSYVRSWVYGPAPAPATSAPSEASRPTAPASSGPGPASSAPAITEAAPGTDVAVVAPASPGSRPSTPRLLEATSAPSEASRPTAPAITEAAPDQPRVSAPTPATIAPPSGEERFHHSILPSTPRAPSTDVAVVAPASEGAGPANLGTLLSDLADLLRSDPLPNFSERDRGRGQQEVSSVPSLSDSDFDSDSDSESDTLFNKTVDALCDLRDENFRREVLEVMLGINVLSARDADLMATKIEAEAPLNPCLLGLAGAIRDRGRGQQEVSSVPSLSEAEADKIVADTLLRTLGTGDQGSAALNDLVADCLAVKNQGPVLSPLEPSLVPDLDPGELAALALDCALAALGQWFGVLLPSPDMPLMPFQYRLVLFLTPIAAVYCPFVVGFTAFLEALERRGYLAPGTALAFGGYLLNLGLVPAEMLRSDFRLNLGMPLLLYRSLPLILFRLLLLLPLKLATVLCLVPFGPWILASLRRESPQSLLF